MLVVPTFNAFRINERKSSGYIADQSIITNASAGTLEVGGGTLEIHVDVTNAGLIEVLGG